MAASSPWKRRRDESRVGCFMIYRHTPGARFDHFIDANIDLNIDTKRAALKISPSVVSLTSLTGGNRLFMGSGTIIRSEEQVGGTYFSTILTSASLVRLTSESNVVPDDIKINVYLRDCTLLEGQVFAYDLHYNLAVIKIKTNVALPCARTRMVDDSISIDPNAIQEPFQLRPHSELFKLSPGDMVIAIGRYFVEPCALMAAPGYFSLDCVKLDCKELFMAKCEISKCGIGGPLINRYGEVIGVNFYGLGYTPFLPINIAVKCLEHFERYGRFYRPCLGMVMTNLYAATIRHLDRLTLRFPDISKGVLVEEVFEGSSAGSGGICSGDVITQCMNNDVQSFLELYGMLLDKMGESVELDVLRVSSGQRLHISVQASERDPDGFYRWPLPEKCEVMVKRVR